MDARYSKNLGALTAGEMTALQTKRVCVVGCGGLGCYVVEELARIGVGAITVADGDVFEETNLNRQLYSSPAVLGKNKAEAAAERVAAINPDVSVRAVAEDLSPENAADILSGCDLAVDALDSGSARKILAEACAGLGLALVHGAISGWRAQVSVLPPGSDAFDFFYPDSAAPATAASLSFTPAVCASLEAAEAVKILLGKGCALKGKLLMIDLLTQEYNTLTL